MTAVLTPRNIAIIALLAALVLLPLYTGLSGNRFMLTLFTRIIILALAGFAGLMQAPILTVQIGMGENIVILAFVITVIGGVGSIRGALVAAIFVGFIDTLGRAFFPDLLRMALSKEAAATAAPALSSMLIYLLMAIVLVVKPEGLFSAGQK